MFSRTCCFYLLCALPRCRTYRPNVWTTQMPAKHIPLHNLPSGECFHKGLGAFLILPHITPTHPQCFVRRRKRRHVAQSITFTQQLAEKSECQAVWRIPPLDRGILVPCSALFPNEESAYTILSLPSVPMRTPFWAGFGSEGVSRGKMILGRRKSWGCRQGVKMFFSLFPLDKKRRPIPSISQKRGSLIMQQFPPNGKRRKEEGK